MAWAASTSPTPPAGGRSRSRRSGPSSPRTRSSGTASRRRSPAPGASTASTPPRSSTRAPRPPPLARHRLRARPLLHQVVAQHGPLPERTVLLLLAGIAEALQAIHSAGVVHRDLKPGNVLVAADGPRVIDFGIARAADASPLTGTGLRIGSPGFMAPEQALGRPATPATDVFALGALIAFVGSGTAPFGDGPESASLYRAVHEEPDLSRLPLGLHDLALRCLAKDPADRPDTGWLIEAARNHPATGGELRFSDDWLPRQVSTELHRHSELPTTPPPPATELDPARAAADAPTARVRAVPAPTLLQPEPSPLAPVAAERRPPPAAAPSPPC
ncbi:serine/threonine-protein kinase [Kitasatospora aburaviensis]